MVKLFQGILGKVLGEIIGGFILMQSGCYKKNKGNEGADRD